MVSLMQRRREMMRLATTPPTPRVPTGYTEVQYIQRRDSAGESSGYNTLFQPNGTDTLLIHIGVMLTKAPSSSSGGYFLGCRQNNSGNTVGFGVYASQDCKSLGTFDGTACAIQPNGGSSILNTKVELVVTKTNPGLSITDGTHSNTTSGTPRAMADALRVFGIKKYNSSNSNLPVWGRIYYCKIWEGGVLKTDLIPCTRDADSANGFWDAAVETFRTSTVYDAGPTV